MQSCLGEAVRSRWRRFLSPCGVPTDRFAAENPQLPDRWHLEADGVVLAYQISHDLDMTATGWHEWVNGTWLPSSACASPSKNEDAGIIAEGFSEAALNGRYVETTSLASLYAHMHSQMDSRQRSRAGPWVKEGGTGEKLTLRFTNKRGDLCEATAELRFDRWHIERGRNCRAHLCQAHGRSRLHDSYKSQSSLSRLALPTIVFGATASKAHPEVLLVARRQVRWCQLPIRLSTRAHTHGTFTRTHPYIHFSQRASLVATNTLAVMLARISVYNGMAIVAKAKTSKQARMTTQEHNTQTQSQTNTHTHTTR